MIATIPSQTQQQMLLINSFWNLINGSDEAVQLGVYSLFKKKYAQTSFDVNTYSRPRTSFRQMKGILQTTEDNDILRDEYLNSKYEL